jgi:hypothetical protein
MFWIYAPPIILVIALAGLAVMLGRKSSEFKKIGLSRKATDADLKNTRWSERLNSAGRGMLRFLEIILNFAKDIFRKIEEASSNWAVRLRARRSGKKIEEVIEDKPSDNSPNEESIIQEIEKTEKLSVDLTGIDEDARYVGSEVVVRKKITEDNLPPVRKEPLPEDKVREAALVYRIAENPRDIEAYREIGDYYMGISNIKDAKESFKMVLKLRPRDLKAKSSLREIEMRMRLGS